MASVRCPTCDKSFDPAASPAMPFCSERCRGVDLNRWLREDIALPYGEVSDDDQPRADDDESEN
jgi:hypothetical protein